MSNVHLLKLMRMLPLLCKVYICALILLSRSDAIYSAMYDGSGLIEVLRGHEYLSHPFAVTMYGGEVYWTDWRTNTLAKANKWTGHNVTVVQRTNTQPFDLQVYHPSRQPQGRFHTRHRCINVHL